MMNNLFELTLPIESDTAGNSKTSNRLITTEVQDADTFVMRCSLPFTFLIQKLEL
jgi:hypothetical protein